MFADFVDSLETGSTDSQFIIADFFCLQIQFHCPFTGNVGMTAAISRNLASFTDVAYFGHKLEFITD